MFSKAKQSIFSILQKPSDQTEISTVEYLRSCMRIFATMDKLEKFAENFKKLCEQENANEAWLLNFEEFLKVYI